jgi:hypothetical protein
MGGESNGGGGMLDRVRLYFATSLGGRRHRESFRDVETYCTFIGYPRSGHSIIGSLLDAHPKIIIAHELDALKFLEEGVGRERIYSLLLHKSQLFKKRGAVSSGYTYKVPNQWQGEYEALKVIGDKKGAGTIKRLQERPELLDRLRQTIDVPVKFVHVLRNPYDNITTIFSRKQQKLEAPPTLDESADYYFSLCETVAEVKARVGADDVLDVRLEDFIADPEATLTTVCRFLGLEASEEYLRDCASIVYDSPNKSRHKAAWSPEQIDAVARRMETFPFLAGYSYES